MHHCCVSACMLLAARRTLMVRNVSFMLVAAGDDAVSGLQGWTGNKHTCVQLVGGSSGCWCWQLDFDCNTIRHQAAGARY